MFDQPNSLGFKKGGKYCWACEEDPSTQSRRRNNWISTTESRSWITYIHHVEYSEQLYSYLITNYSIVENSGKRKCGCSKSHTTELDRVEDFSVSHTVCVLPKIYVSIHFLVLICRNHWFKKLLPRITHVSVHVPDIAEYHFAHPREKHFIFFTN